MALDWTDKRDGIDDVFAEDINSIAQEVIRQGEEIKNMSAYDDTEIRNNISIIQTDILNLQDHKADKSYVDEQTTFVYNDLVNQISPLQAVLENKADKSEVKSLTDEVQLAKDDASVARNIAYENSAKIGDIETALLEIEAIADGLIGGDA